MGEYKLLKMEEAEVGELTALVEAEMERRLEAIHTLLQARLAPTYGYKEPDIWAEVKAKIVELVQSPLEGIRKGLPFLVAAPPADPGKN